MAFSRRAPRLVAAVVLALGAGGCVTGHLLDATRRTERPVAFHDAYLDEDRLVLAFTAVVTDQFGRPLGRVERRAEVGLTALRRPDVPVEDLTVEHLPDGALLRGRRVPLFVDADPPEGARTFVQVEESGDPRLTRLLLHDPPAAYAPLYAGALVRTRTAAWVYPLVPLGLAADAVVDPVLLFFAPAVIVTGD